jgi:hypothetical protein
VLLELLPSLLGGLACGLVTWGGLRVELRYLRRDIDRAHNRLDRIEERATGLRLEKVQRPQG